MNGHDFRLFYEKYAIDCLARYLKVNAEKIKHLTKENPISSYDLDFFGIRFDVKYANPTLTNKQKKTPLWDFDLREKNKNCDFYLCIGMKNGIPKSVFLIPSDSSPSRHIRISVDGKTKYKKYEI